MIFINMFLNVSPLKSYDLEIIMDKQSVINESAAFLKSSHYQISIIGYNIIIETIFENHNTEKYEKTEIITEGNNKEDKYSSKYTIKVKEVFNEVHEENHVISLRIPCEGKYNPLIKIIKKSIKGRLIKTVKGNVLILPLHILKCNKFSTICKNYFKEVKQHFNTKTEVTKEIKNVKLRINLDKKLVFINGNKDLFKYLISKYTIRTYKSVEPIKELISRVDSTFKVGFINTLKKNSFIKIQISTSPELSTYDNKTYIIYEWDAIGLSKEYEIYIINVNILILNTENNNTRLYTCDYQYNMKTINIPIKNNNSEEGSHFNYFDEVIKHIGMLNAARAHLKKELNLFLKHLRIMIWAQKVYIKEKEDINDLNKFYNEILHIYNNFTYSSTDLLKSNCVLKDQSNIKCLQKIYRNNRIFKCDRKHFTEIHNLFETKILPCINACKISLNEYRALKENYKVNEINRRLIQYSKIIFNKNNKFSFIITFAIKKKGKLKFICKNYLTVAHRVYEL